MKIDKEQKKYLEENRAVYQFVKSKGWKICKGKLMERIDDLQSIMNVDGKTAEEVLLDVKTRKLIVQELLDWVKSIDGQAEQYEGNLDSLDETEDSYIVTEEE